MRRHIALSIPLLVALLAGPVATAAAPPDQADQEAVEVRVLSNRADLVSGGDALVEVVLPDDADAASVVIDVEGRDVSDAFAVRDDGRFYGRVEGLAVGVNRVTATLADGSGAYLDVTNHPIGGPVFAGPQIQPWVCNTEANGLGPAIDEQCNAPTAYRFQYKSSTTGQFQSYDPESPPSDVAMTTTDEGSEVPYIVRIERGTIDRGIYDIAVLFDPAQPFEPWAQQQGWNGKLYVPFGGDCKPHHQQEAPPGVLLDRPLSRGFAVASSGLNILGRDCNDVVLSEALMMVKERVVEAYGEIRYTMSEGCSGGSMQQHWIAANYPGVLDGIQPSCSYPDIWATMQAAEDCHQMDRVFDEVSPQLWANPQQQADVAGHAAATTCRSLWDGPGIGYAKTWLDPDNAAGCGLDSAVVYSAETNPDGVRCTLQDYAVAVWGRRASDGFANRPFDNVGVQYGLTALESGQVLPEQFVDLNEHAGGLDIDWNHTPERSVADPAAIEIAYRAGKVTYGGELANVPIVDIRGSSNLEIHTDIYSYVTRERLVEANGHHDNQVIFTSGVPLAGDPESVEQSFLLLDQWLAAIESDPSEAALAEKVRRNKPVEAVDACWINGEKITDQTTCRAAFPYFATPRITAGGPLADNVIKCQLTPLARDDYDVTFTDAQWERLQQAFPDGVCDYRQPGVGQQPSVPWLTFADGPGGEPLGAAPVSVPFGPDGLPAPGVDVVRRVAGDSRVDTSVGLSREAFESADAAVLARADDYPDALAASALAAELDAPVLLTPTGGLDDQVGDELERLGVTRAYLMGGTQALSQQVQQDLDSRNVDHTRIGGAERFATAALIADEVVALGGPIDHAILALGARPHGTDAWPDAIAAGNLAAHARAPILLTTPDTIPEATAATLDRHLDDGNTVYIVGGTNAVGNQPEAQLGTDGYATTRLAGAERYATAVAIVEEAVQQGGSRDPLLLATGTDFADALVAGPAAAHLGGTMLLVDPNDLDGSPATRDYLTDHADQIGTVLLTGGPQTIDEQVADQITTLITDPEGQS